MVWDGVKNLAGSAAGATAGVVKHRGGQLLQFVSDAPKNAAVFGARAVRKVSDGAAHLVERALLNKEERVERKKAEYSDTLDRLLKVQTWFEKNAPEWLSEQLENPAGKHSRVLLRPEEVRSLRHGRREPDTKRLEVVGPERTPDRSASAFCAKYKCAGKTLKKCRNQSLKKWHPDKNAGADPATMARLNERTKRLNGWWTEVEQHRDEMCGP